MYERFEKLCEMKGVTAYKVSQATGIATSTLTSWKKGGYTPKLSKLQKIADYFGISVDYLTGDADKPALVLSDLEREIILAFRQMDDSEKRMMLRSCGIEKDAESSDSQNEKGA